MGSEERKDEGLAGQVPDPEVSDHPKRRIYPVKYKLKILEELDACRASGGDIGAVLRREGLYSSLVSSWNRQRSEGILQGLSPQKRGRKPKRRDPLASRVAELEKKNRKLEEELRKAQAIIDVQKKLSELLK